MPTYIYGLIDPRDEAIHYVGQTSTSLKQRLIHHRSSRRTMSWMRVRVWIQSLVDAGYQPDIVLLEEVDANLANEVERRWIVDLMANGHSLANTTYTGQEPLVTTRWKEIHRQRAEAWQCKIASLPPQSAPPLISPEDIKAFRASLGLSQKQLAAAIGYHDSAVSLWESGKRRPPPSLQIILDRIREQYSVGHNDY